MAGSADRDEERRFTPNSGTVAGWAGLVLAAGVLVLVLVNDRSLVSIRFALAVALFGLLVWCYLLRPRVVIGPAELELRNPFSSWHVPLADVRKVAVRAVTRVYTDERRFDGVAVGRTVRSMRRGRSGTRRAAGPAEFGGAVVMDDHADRKRPHGDLDADGVADFVTEQILQAADRARATPGDERAAHRSWAWLELAGVALLVVGLVVSLLV